MADEPMVTAAFSASSLLMFRELLDQVRLAGDHPHLVQAATQIATARSELDEALAPKAAPEGAST